MVCVIAAAMGSAVTKPAIPMLFSLLALIFNLLEIIDFLLKIGNFFLAMLCISIIETKNRK